MKNEEHLGRCDYLIFGRQNICRITDILSYRLSYSCIAENLSFTGFKMSRFGSHWEKYTQFTCIYL